MNTRSKIGAILIAMVVLPGLTSASPLVTISVLGRVTGSGNPFSSHLPDSIVSAGQSIDYELVVQMAPIGTTNTQGTTTRTITSLTAGVDGMNSTKHDIVDASNFDGIETNLNQALTFANGWGDGTGASGGTPTIRSGTNDDLLSVRAVHSTGVFSGISQEIIGSATFQLTTGGGGLGELSLITARWFQGGSGAIKFNGNITLIPNNTSENGSDPIIGYKALTFSPEPNSLVLIGISLAGLASRRRRR